MTVMETLLEYGTVGAVAAATPNDYTAVDADDDDCRDDGIDCALCCHQNHHDYDGGDVVTHCSMNCDHTTVAAGDGYYCCCSSHAVAAVVDQRQ